MVYGEGSRITRKCPWGVEGMSRYGGEGSSITRKCLTNGIEV